MHFYSLEEVAKTLKENNIETEIFQLGNKPICGCIGCATCRKTGECFMKDIVNEFVEKAKMQMDLYLVLQYTMPQHQVQ